MLCFSWREPIKVQYIKFWVVGCYFSWSYNSFNFSCSANYYKNRLKMFRETGTCTGTTFILTLFWRVWRDLRALFLFYEALIWVIAAFQSQPHLGHHMSASMQSQAQAHMAQLQAQSIIKPSLGAAPAMPPAMPPSVLAQQPPPPLMGQQPQPTGGKRSTQSFLFFYFACFSCKLVVFFYS